MHDKLPKPIRFTDEQEALIRDLMKQVGEKNFSGFLRQCVGSLKMQSELIEPMAEGYKFFVEPYDKLFKKEFQRYPAFYKLWKERNKGLKRYERFVEKISNIEVSRIKPLLDTKVGAKKKPRKRGRPKN